MNHASDLTKLRRLQNRILARKGLVCCGSEYTAAIHSREKVVFVGANRYGQRQITSHEGATYVACSSRSAVVLMKDGTLRLPTQGDGYSPDAKLEGLAHVRSVGCSDTHIAALLGNGHVAVGGCKRSYTAASDVSEWPVVRDVVCGKSFTAGLTPDGRVTLAGGGPRLRYRVSSWQDAAGLFVDAEGEHLYAVTVDGIIRSTARLPRSVRAWRNLVFVAASGPWIMGITAAGQLLSTGPSPARPEDKAGFVACAVSVGHAVALSRDGHVRSVGNNDFGQCDTQRFGRLFESFDEFTADRRALMRRVVSDERDYQVRLSEASRYGSRMLCGQRMSACITADGRVVTSAGFGKAKGWQSVRALACGNAHLVALHVGGWVSADGNDTDGCTRVDDWRGVKCIAAGKYHTLGVTEDGQVLFCGRNDQGQGNITDWKGIRRVYATADYTVGLGYDGTLRVAGKPPFDPALVATWESHPAYVAVTATHMAALYPNGQVLSTIMVPASEHSEDGETWDTCNWEGIRAIAAGNGFTVGLSYDGRVMASHGTSAEISNALSGWRGVVSLACGRDFVLGLTADGRVLSAGSLQVELHTADPLHADRTEACFARETPDTESWRAVIAMTAGPNHALAMTREGNVLSTGLDSDGQCSSTAHFTLFRDSRQLYGYGKYRKVSECGITPPHVPENTEEDTVEEATIVPFARYAAHLRADTIAILSRLTGDDERLTVRAADGRVITYTYETAAMVEDAADNFRTANHKRYRQNSADKWLGAVSVATSGTHTVALFGDGHVEAVGHNENGECDTASWSHVVQINVMPELTLGLRADGKVLAAGRHHAVLHTLDTVRAIACFGSRRQVFVMADGTLRIHVRGSEFLPEPLGGVRLFTPGVSCSVLDRAFVGGVPAVTARRLLGSFALGMAHTLTLGEGGSVTATGTDDSGQWGVASYGGVVQVAAGPYHSAAILADGSMVASGRNPDGRCDYRILNRELDTVGASAEESRHSAVPALSDPDPSLLPYAWVQVACGHEHTAALRSDGRVYAVGANPDGRCDTRKWRDIRQVACGVRHTVALRADGTCVATGDNRYGQCDVSLWKNIVMVAVGEFHTVGLCADGRVETAGDNRKGQCHAEDLRDMISVACLPEATLCIRADGRVILRGGDGELNRSVEALREVVAIHACEHRVAALTVDRRVILLP